MFIEGVMSWLLVIPVDVIKTRMQADDLSAPEYKGLIACAKKSYQEEGLKVFTRGVVMCSVRSFPVNAATFVGFEWSQKLCQELLNNHLS